MPDVYRTKSDNRFSRMLSEKKLSTRQNMTRQVRANPEERIQTADGVLISGEFQQYHGDGRFCPKKVRCMSFKHFLLNA